MVINEFHEEIHFDAVPRRLQRALSAALAPVGRLAGYRARYPRSGEDSS